MNAIEDLAELKLCELNNRPVAIRPIGGVGKCSYCDNIAKWTVFELWGGVLLPSDSASRLRVWHWCGICANEPYPSNTFEVR